MTSKSETYVESSQSSWKMCLYETVKHRFFFKKMHQINLPVSSTFNHLLNYCCKRYNFCLVISWTQILGDLSQHMRNYGYLKLYAEETMWREWGPREMLLVQECLSSQPRC